ncbi:ornithine cyclodeaminase family protein [Variovorax sp. RKNM96]|uniref:ornithine cyclodeaminase family protein n=1 Tax=Variovorax sp. RKNM96 TaxID=2681552 RepID=UPI00197F3F80|nr:ornithine cyclodeaminase family protein [Variovorax sp. RKNM96]QSI31260.1 ornithine cyclodeaminase family protein [Variovorax sp. RKNM96]
MKIIDTESTRHALRFERLIPALRDMFIAGCEVPLRHVHTLQNQAAPPGGTVLIMPAWQEGRYLGIKTVNIFPGNAERGLPGLFSTYMLYDARTGEPLAQIDGNEITSRRTAAASALAASYLAPAQARSLLVVGCGRVGGLVPEACRTVRPIERVAVWDRNEAAANALAARLHAQGFDAFVATDLGQAAGDADIVSCATLATQPVIEGAWLGTRSHLDLIGSFTPQMREADDAAFVGARLFIDTREALQKSGELLGPMSRGVFTAADVAGDLADLVTGRVQGRTESDGRTVFKAVGTALEDLAAAILVYESVEAA